MDCLICHRMVISGAYGGDSETCCGVCRKALADARERTAKYFTKHGSPQTVRGGCEVCGGDTKVFWSSGRAAKYCSPSCRNRANARHGSIDLSRTCPTCEREFSTRQPGQKFCSADCRIEAGRARDRENKSGGTHERRCRKYNTEYRRIDPMKIFERDSWMCQICLAPVDKDVVFPDQLSATLDHIVPLSKGGDHIESNLQTAHWACNSAKSNKLMDDLCQAEGHQHRQHS